MTPEIYTIQLNEAALNSFLTVAAHANTAYQQGTAKRTHCEAIWDFGEHLMNEITTLPKTSVEDVFRMAFGYTETYPMVDMPTDVVDQYLQALEKMTATTGALRSNPYQDALDTFRRNEETLNRQ